MEIFWAKLNVSTWESSYPQTCPGQHIYHSHMLKGLKTYQSSISKILSSLWTTDTSIFVPISDTFTPRTCLQCVRMGSTFEEGHWEAWKHSKIWVEGLSKKKNCTVRMRTSLSLLMSQLWLWGEHFCQFYSMGLQLSPELLHMLIVFGLSTTPPWFNLFHTQTFILTYFPLYH